MSNPLAPAWLATPENPNALDPRLWPERSVRDSRGVVSLGHIPVDSLVEQFGSPVYLLDLDDLASRARFVRDTLTAEISRPHRSVFLYYATKSLISSDVLRVISAEGIGCDVSTRGELEWALASGVSPEHCEFQGNNKSEAELRLAIERGVGTIVVDSDWEATRLARITSDTGVRQKVMIRVNTGVHASTHEYLATAREDQKFGIARSEVKAVADIIKDSSQLDLVGLHSHIGSQIVQPEGFVEAAERLLEVYQTLSADHPLDTVNLGGGFAIPYTSADPESNLLEIARSLGEVFDRWEKRGVNVPHVAFEPGRIISGPAGVTVYTVGTTKQVVVSDSDSGSIRLYVSVDGGMSDNLRTALYGAHYSVRLANRESSAPPALVRVVGKHCESGDIVVSDDYLPADVTPGDLLVVAATGAYCYSLASNYNAVGRPALVVVQGGEARVGLAAETVEDVMSKDVGLALGTPKTRGVER